MHMIAGIHTERDKQIDIKTQIILTSLGLIKRGIVRSAKSFLHIIMLQ